MNGQDDAPVVALTQAAKHFGPVRALDGVSLQVAPGDCLGLVGHNGAGKSTLVNLINGTFGPSSGTVDFPSGAGGVRSVFQELSLCPNLTVAENLRVSHPGLKGIGWRRAARAEIGATLDAVFPGHGIDPDAEIDRLSIAERQMVEIAIGFAPRGGRARLVILDEPTSSLDEGIARQLLAHVRGFCAAGGAVIFISHMLGEIFAVASRIVVLKDGRVVADRPAAEFTRAGLLDGRKATIHWENQDSFAEEFEDVILTKSVFVIDGNRYTTAGGTSSIDLMLKIIADDHGQDLANAVADQLIHSAIRTDQDVQRLSVPTRIGVRHPKLSQVIHMMEANIEEPISPALLAREVGLSTRQLERLFRRYLNRSPKRYYMELRLQKARNLLMQTDMSVINVALACGFTSPSHFSKCYRSHYGTTPYRERGSHPSRATV